MKIDSRAIDEVLDGRFAMELINLIKDAAADMPALEAGRVLKDILIRANEWIMEDDLDSLNRRSQENHLE